MYRVALRLHSTQASSAYCKRELSLAGNLVSKLHTQLMTTDIEQLMFLAWNANMIREIREIRDWWLTAHVDCAAVGGGYWALGSALLGANCLGPGGAGGGFWAVGCWELGHGH